MEDRTCSEGKLWRSNRGRSNVGDCSGYTKDSVIQRQVVDDLYGV